jgi:hypothetical protein
VCVLVCACGRVADTRVFVYTSEMDAVVFHDVGPKRIPTAHYWDADEKKLLAVQTDKVRGVCRVRQRRCIWSAFTIL